MEYKSINLISAVVGDSRVILETEKDVRAGDVVKYTAGVGYDPILAKANVFVSVAAGSEAHVFVRYASRCAGRTVVAVYREVEEKQKSSGHGCAVLILPGESHPPDHHDQKRGMLHAKGNDIDRAVCDKPGRFSYIHSGNSARGQECPVGDRSSRLRPAPSGRTALPQYAGSRRRLILGRSRTNCEECCRQGGRVTNQHTLTWQRKGVQTWSTVLFI